MEKALVIKSIIYIPTQFNIRRNISFYSLLNETGYFEFSNIITEADIFEELLKNNDSVDQWLVWSEDKRADSGWCFNKNENGMYIVGYFPQTKDSKLFEYKNKGEACAKYIKQELEEILNNQ